MYVITSKASTIPIQKSLGLCRIDAYFVIIKTLLHPYLHCIQALFCQANVNLHIGNGKASNESETIVLNSIPNHPSLVGCTTACTNSFVVFGISIGTSTYLGGNETDHQALLAFKTQITRDPENVFNSWNDSLHFCEWEGVTYDRKHRRVIVLDLQARGLVGSLSPYIGNLSFIREIVRAGKQHHWKQNP